MWQVEVVSFETLEPTTPGDEPPKTPETPVSYRSVTSKVGVMQNEVSGSCSTTTFSLFAFFVIGNEQHAPSQTLVLNAYRTPEKRLVKSEANRIAVY